MAVFNRNKFLLVGIVVMVLLAACQPAASIPVTSGSSASVTITAQDFSFNIPAQVQSGPTTFTLQNDGKETHQAQFFRLNENVTLDQFTTALKSGTEDFLGLVTAYGGPGPIPPGGQDAVIVNLDPGQYVVVCFISGQDSVPHFAKGMIKDFQVVANSSGTANEPQASGSVTLKDFTIEVPANISAGQQIWKVVNNGPQPHEMGIVKLAEGKTMADVQAFMANPQGGPPPFEEAGGMQALSAGKSGWVTLDLQPGNYLALCFVPDPATGKAHAELGMITPFSVK